MPRILVRKIALVVCLASSVALTGTSHASGNHSGNKLSRSNNAIMADSHAPIGVMGDHTHAKGEWMVSYRYMTMDMSGNLQGSTSISSDDIATSVANPNPGPANVRVVPLNMTTEMHMIGLMYAPTDKLTLMTMFNTIKKDMDHLTYMGMMGTTQLGNFNTQTSGLGDTKLGGLYSLVHNATHKLHLNLSLSIPTGSITEEHEVLTPMGTRPRIRLPYAMQLGSGTYDLEPGITYTGHLKRLGWGAQYQAAIRLSDNDENYTLGDVHKLTSWASYRFVDSISASLRLSYKDQDSIDGADAMITAPVTTANPDNYGGEQLALGFGINLVAQSGSLRGHRLALEYETTLDQNANGVQMEMSDMLTVGWQLAF